MDEGTFENISSVTISKEVWKILLNTPNKVDKVQKVHLQTHWRIWRFEYERIIINLWLLFFLVLTIVNLLERNCDI